MKMIIIGASAGALEPLKQLTANLASDIDAAMLIVRHVLPGTPSVLAAILEQQCLLPVLDAADDMVVQAATVYIAPPGHHTTIDSDADGVARFHVVPIKVGERGTPSVDKAMVSAARLFGQDCIGVVLSGYLDDGTRGAQVLDAFDGVMIVQDPHQAVNDSMPWNVIMRDSPDFVLDDVSIAELLNTLSSEVEVFDYLKARRAS